MHFLGTIRHVQYGRRAHQPSRSHGVAGQSSTQLLSDAIAKLQTGFTKPEEETDPVTNTVRKTLDDMAWKFGVMFADARDAQQDRVTPFSGIAKIRIEPNAGSFRLDSSMVWR